MIASRSYVRPILLLRLHECAPRPHRCRDHFVADLVREGIRYALTRWRGLTRFIDDGRIELDNNTVERSIRGIKLCRKNALFAGSDGGAEHWAVVASLIETCKINEIDPLAYLTDVLTRIVNGHPNRDIDQLLPWTYRGQSLKAVA